MTVLVGVVAMVIATTSNISISGEKSNRSSVLYYVPAQQCLMDSYRSSIYKCNSNCSMRI